MYNVGFAYCLCEKAIDFRTYSLWEESFDQIFRLVIKLLYSARLSLGPSLVCTVDLM